MNCWLFKNQAYCDVTGVGSVIPLARSLFIAALYAWRNIFYKKSAVSDNFLLK